MDHDNNDEDDDDDDGIYVYDLLTVLESG